MTRDDWERQLDADPSDTVTRAVFADWLEDHGEPIAAACQRWMVREGKWPLHAWKYVWSLEQNIHRTTGSSHHHVPKSVFRGLRGWKVRSHFSRGVFVSYESVVDAVAELQCALLALGWIGEEVRR